MKEYLIRFSLNRFHTTMTRPTARSNWYTLTTPLSSLQPNLDLSVLPKILPKSASCWNDLCGLLDCFKVRKDSAFLEKNYSSFSEACHQNSNKYPFLSGVFEGFFTFAGSPLSLRPFGFPVVVVPRNPFYLPWSV